MKNLITTILFVGLIIGALSQFDPPRNPLSDALGKFDPKKKPRSDALGQFDPKKTPLSDALGQFDPKKNPLSDALDQFGPKKNPLSDALGQFDPKKNPLSDAALSGINKLKEVAAFFKKQFGDFQQRFNKVYSSPEEEEKRLEIFSTNQQLILDFEKIKNLPFILKLNEYADLISDEFNKLVNGLAINKENSHAKRYRPQLSAPVDSNVDWKKRGGVTPSKSQGACGSCYAFAAAGALEGHIFRKTGQLVPLSPQNILDCTKGTPYNNLGCANGAVDPAFDLIKDKNGINSETVYPYEGKAKDQCEYKPTEVAASLTGYALLDEGDEKAMEEVLSTKGPIAVAFDAHAQSWQFYGGGIYYEPKCSADIEKVNHAVLLIGYGTEPTGEKYWLIKNSYGPSWGEDGFAKISKNVTNHCGIATYALYPEV